MKPFQTTEKPKLSTDLNKRTLAIIIGCGILILLLLITTVFQRPRQKAAPTTIPVAPLSQVDDNTHAAIDKLPSNYEDSDAIKKYLPKQPQTIPASVQAELDSFKQSQSDLQKQIADLNDQLHRQQEQKSNVEPISSGYTTKDAMQSQNLFSGPGLASPYYQPPATNAKVATPVADKNATKNIAPLNSFNSNSKGDDEKLSFLNSSTDNDPTAIYNKHPLQKPASRYIAQAHTIIRATLTANISNALPGTVVARVQADIYDSITGKYLLIPKGSTLIGKVDTKSVYGDSRLLVVFNRIIRPDGSSVQLDGLAAADIEGESGMDAKVNNHWGSILGATLISSLLTVPTYLTDNNNNNDNSSTCTQINPTTGQCMQWGNGNNGWSDGKYAALNAANQNLAQVGQQLITRSMNLKPTLSQKAGYEFDLVLNKDVILSPYHDDMGNDS